MKIVVDWLIEELEDNGFKYLDLADEIIEDARKLFKQQIIEARENGFYSSKNWVGDSEDYYNLIYNKI